MKSSKTITTLILTTAITILSACGTSISADKTMPKPKEKPVVGVTAKRPEPSKKTSPKKVKARKKVKEIIITYWNVPLSRDLQKYIKHLCTENGISERLMYGVMKIESSFNPNKISTTDDYGLMQINVVNRGWLAQKLHITNWFDPYQNTKAGAYMLGDLVKKYHTENIVAMAYNLGEGGMRYFVRHGIYSTEYSRKVEKASDSLQTRSVVVEEPVLESQ